MLRNPLPTSASTTKQVYHDRLKEKWVALWEASDRSQRPLLAEDTFPYNDFHKRTYLLTRQQASLMIQIRSGHIPLNGYLYKIGRAETFLCQACNNHDNRVQCCETVNHFIFECTAYTEERDMLVGIIGRRHFNLHNLMSSTDNMCALASFVNRTGRFKKS